MALSSCTAHATGKAQKKCSPGTIKVVVTGGGPTDLAQPTRDPWPSGSANQGGQELLGPLHAFTLAIREYTHHLYFFGILYRSGSAVLGVALFHRGV